MTSRRLRQSALGVLAGLLLTSGAAVATSAPADAAVICWQGASGSYSCQDYALDCEDFGYNPGWTGNDFCMNTGLVVSGNDATGVRSVHSPVVAGH